MSNYNSAYNFGDKGDSDMESLENLLREQEERANGKAEQEIKPKKSVYNEEINTDAKQDFIRYPKDLFVVMFSGILNKRELQIINLIIKFTVGFNGRRYCNIPVHKFVKYTRLSSNAIYTTINNLAADRIIYKSDLGYSVNFQYNTWLRKGNLVPENVIEMGLYERDLVANRKKSRR